MNRRMVCIAVSVVLMMSLTAGCGGGRPESEPLSDLPPTVTSSMPLVTTTTTTAADEVGSTTSTTATVADGTGSTTTTSTTATRGKGESTTTSTATTTAAQGPTYHDGLEVAGTIAGRAMLCRFDENLYKLDVPFENIYTAVFFLKLADGEWAIIDTATYSSDVDTYIVPAANYLGISLSRVKGILLTHDHQDHAGGLAALFPKCPNATVYGVSASNSVAGSRYQSIADGASLFGGTVKMVTLRGHAAEACGYYDTRSKTVMTGDSIQFYGAGQYGCQVYGGLAHYEASMQKLKTMVEDGIIENIIISHKYVPVSAVSKGRENSIAYMTTAQRCYEDIKTYTIDKYNSGTVSASEIASAFMAERSRQYADFPTNYFHNVMGTIINTYC